MSSLISLTPIAEYVDLLYTRGATELESIEGLTWWVELRPPTPGTGISGTVRLVGIYRGAKPVRHIANMHAIQKGATVSIENQTTVVDMHIRKFKEEIHV